MSFTFKINALKSILILLSLTLTACFFEDSNSSTEKELPSNFLSYCYWEENEQAKSSCHHDDSTCIKDVWKKTSEIDTYSCGRIGVITDERDKQSYKTIKIGNQTWFAENLNYQSNDSFCYDDIPENCEILGRLYTWNAALTACPEGWKLPSWGAFYILTEYVRTNSYGLTGVPLKSIDTWEDRILGVNVYNGNGKDLYGFNATPNGKKMGESNGYIYVELGESGDLWTSTREGAYIIRLRIDSGLFASSSNISESVALAVRCLKEE
jgi:uncharacterized protein (TIGR02145 family)